MRIREPRTTALIFSSGKMVCTGAKSEEDSRLAARKYARIIQKLGFAVRLLDNLLDRYSINIFIRFLGKVFRLQNPKHGRQLWRKISYSFGRFGIDTWQIQFVRTRIVSGPNLSYGEAAYRSAHFRIGKSGVDWGQGATRDLRCIRQYLSNIEKFQKTIRILTRVRFVVKINKMMSHGQSQLLCKSKVSHL